jgi:7-cyano-7-deazaguanine synthase
MAKKCIVLLSGGLDSATVAAVAFHDGYEIYAISFEYGQRHFVELDSAVKIAHKYKVIEHLIIKIPADIFRNSSLSSLSKESVPKNRSIQKNQDIPTTYVPARNILFLSYALSYAETIGASDIFIGVNALDYSGYPDCRPEFIEAFQTMANKGTRTGSQGGEIRIHVPLVKLSKKEIILLGTSLDVDYAMTHSCYDPTPDGKACGACDSCVLRKKGFSDAGISDPTFYSDR